MSSIEHLGEAHKERLRLQWQVGLLQAGVLLHASDEAVEEAETNQSLDVDALGSWIEAKAQVLDCHARSHMAVEVQHPAEGGHLGAVGSTHIRETLLMQGLVRKQSCHLWCGHVDIGILKDGHQCHNAIVDQVLDARLHQIHVCVRQCGNLADMIEAIDVGIDLLSGQIPTPQEAASETIRLEYDGHVIIFRLVGHRLHLGHLQVNCCRVSCGREERM